MAASVAASPYLRLVGIEGFESVVEHLDPPDVLAAVDGFLLAMRTVAQELARNGAFADLDEVIMSAGGSTYFDRVPAVLGDLDLGLPVRTLIRAGAYVTHDGGLNEPCRRSLEDPRVPPDCERLSRSGGRSFRVLSPSWPSSDLASATPPTVKACRWPASCIGARVV